MDISLKPIWGYSLAMISHNQLLSSDKSDTILVTGHTGFKGSWLVMLLHKLGYKTVGISLPPASNSLYLKLDSCDKPTDEYFVDIRNYEEILRIFSSQDFSYAFHLAAQPLVLDSYKDPIKTFATNVMGTTNVLNALLSQKTLKSIGVITTDKVYKNENNATRFSENDELGGKDPYSASKVGTEIVVSAWRELSKLQNGPRIISLRAGNVIGGGDFAIDRLLPDIVRSYINKKPLEIRNLTSTRPWQHVIDPLLGYVMSVILLEDGEIPALNFGPSEPSLSVESVINFAEAAWGKPLDKRVTKQEDMLEAVTLELDSRKAKKVLHWEPFFSQKDAVYSTMNWWKEMDQKNSTASKLCNEEISRALNSYL